MALDTLSPLDLTHVLYDPDSKLSLGLALLTLSPILLMASYASLAVYTRELTIINMWAGQLLCETFNWVIKHAVKQERPNVGLGNGYGFPSSHSQWMAYFATYLICHISFRHRFPPTGSRALDYAFRACVVSALLGWLGVVAYSRLYLSYHTLPQVMWGVGLGVLFGAVFYAVTELIPSQKPQSLLGKLRTFILDNPISIWLRLRDGWLVYDDAGREQEWKEWRAQLDRKRR